MRTSPTNIGLWLTSALAAHDSGYLTTDQVLDRLTKTIATLGRLDRYQGHLFNWYDIQTLAPLEPRYVSTVDSGNLLGALWTLEQGVRELVHAPLLDAKTFAGLADTGELLKQVATQKNIASFCQQTLDTLLTDWHAAPSTVTELLSLQDRTTIDITSVVADATETPWAKELGKQATASARWPTAISPGPVSLLKSQRKSLHHWASLSVLAIRKDLARAPSLSVLAEGRIDSILRLKVIRQKSPDTYPMLTAWLDRLLAAFGTAQWLAGETLAVAEQLTAGIHDLAAETDMRFLYDHRRKLFAIGYNVSTNRLDGSSYDLLASESRLGSFIAIAKGDVPLEHWFSLSRPYGAVGRKRVLLSWTGTMFEYLMPLLFQHSYPHSLLDKAAREAVAVQIDYGRTHGVPWGISESAFADLDLDKTYQYKAFGVPALGLKRGMDEQPVIAPYATLLALNLAPEAVLQNLKRLVDFDLLGDYGYFEAMDFSRQAQRDLAGKAAQTRGDYRGLHGSSPGHGLSGSD